MLKENGYRESIISKIFKRVTNNHSLSQSQQQMQATGIQEEEIKISVNLAYVEGASEKLQQILGSHKIRSTFYTERTLHKLLCKPKDWVTTEDKNNIYKIDCSNSEVIYFGNDLSGIAVVIRMKLQNSVEKQITTLTGKQVNS